SISRAQYDKFKQSILDEISGCWLPYDYSEDRPYITSSINIKSRLSKNICFEKDSLTVFDDRIHAQGYQVKKHKTAQYLQEKFRTTKKEFGTTNDIIYELTVLGRHRHKLFFSSVHFLYDG